MQLQVLDAAAVRTSRGLRRPGWTDRTSASSGRLARKTPSGTMDSRKGSRHACGHPNVLYIPLHVNGWKHLEAIIDVCQCFEGNTRLASC